MQYKNKIFHVENISTEKIVKKFNTPLYCYSYLKLKNNIINFNKYFLPPTHSKVDQICMKFNENKMKLNLNDR